MNKEIETIKKIRGFLLTLVEGLSTEELNNVPAGFNNNIIWNLGHLVAAQQGVCYIRAGLKQPLHDSVTAHYRPGTKPGESIESEEIESIKEFLMSTMDELQKDYDNNTFSSYNTWTTRYGVELSSIDDAVRFLSFHEGLHSGYIMALKRVVRPEVGAAY
jgi:hypothetical protein